MKSPGKPRSTKRAFALVELLAIMAILALLVALRLPALAKPGAANMERAACLNNARQLMVAAFAYSADFDDKWVANNPGDDTVNVANPTAGYKPTVWVLGRDGSGLADEQTAENMVSGKVGLLPPYVKAKGSFRCPSDRPAKLGGKLFLRSRSYGMNIYFGWNSFPWYGEPSGLFRRFTKLGDTPSPANFFVFGEINPNSICRPEFGVHPASRNIYHTPGNQHGRDSNFAFADGHAESHRWGNPLFTNPTAKGEPLARLDPFWHNHDAPHPNAAEVGPDIDWLNAHAAQSTKN